MTTLQLSPSQLQAICNEFTEKPNGINMLLSIILNILMKAERKDFLTTSNGDGNKANGYRSLRGLGIGESIELSIPRDRLGQFKPLLLEVMREQQDTLNELCFELYANGLTTCQVEDITESIYGKKLSKSAVSRIIESLYEEMKAFQERQLERHYPLIYLDATYVKTKRRTVSSEAYYVVLGVKQDKTREVLGIYNAPTESASTWDNICQDLKDRGIQQIQLAIIDDLKGLELTIEKHFACRVQKCVLHLKRRLLNQSKTSHRTELGQDLKDVFRVGKHDSLSATLARAKSCYQKWRKYYPQALAILADEDKLSDYLTYLHYENEVQNMIYTTNQIERLNKSFKRVLKIRNSMPSVDSVLTLMSKVAIDMGETTYRYPLSRFADSVLFK
ncbi:IS256 family transposase [Avibacterium sp. 21-586]|uniref:IS256 family transposase n=1 Tax=Avibacterium sp. 21-586 TaxID=2911534 RepID=UPI00224758EE|nr:IS256 family transposase [Avibacterium sp. 21-586]MCW9710751.1 IS256 family transposase [Avibacterium sp. 21-586]